MVELDVAERDAVTDRDHPALPPEEIRRYLDHLPDWWADADPDDRGALATTLFARIRVLGIRQVQVEPTQEALAHSLADAFGPDDVETVGPRWIAPQRPTFPTRCV